MGFDNLNSLETLNLQNNKLQHIPEEIMEPILDTLRVVDIMGQYSNNSINDNNNFIDHEKTALWKIIL